MQDMNNVQRNDQQVNGHNEGSRFLRTQDRSLYLLWLVWIVWLPFLLPPIIGMFQAHPPLPRLIITLAGIVLFAGIYLRATWRNVQERFATLPPLEQIRVSKQLSLLLLVALSVVLAFLGNVNGNTFLDPFIYTSAYIAGRLSVVRAAQLLIALALLEAAVGWLTALGLFQIGQAVI
jgi:hypothetical protein